MFFPPKNDYEMESPSPALVESPKPPEANPTAAKGAFAKHAKPNTFSWRSLFLYLVFLGTFTYYVVVTQDPSASSFSSYVNKKLNLDNLEVKNREDFLNYLQKDFYTFLFPENLDINIAFEESKFLLPIDATNRILGPLRMRAVRNLKKPCPGGSLFETFNFTCFDDFYQETEDRSIFKSFNYSEDAEGLSFNGQFGQYPPGGYIFQIPINQTDYRKLFSSLESQNFFDDSVRAVFLEFTIYNKNLNIYGVVRICFEFSPSTLAVAKSVDVFILQQKNIGHFASSDYVSLVPDFIILLITLWYIVEEGLELRKSGRVYFYDYWNLMDWMNIFFVLISFYFRLVVYLGMKDIIPGLKELQSTPQLRTNSNQLVQSQYSSPVFVNYIKFASNLEISKQINSFNILLLWFKILKFIGDLPFFRTIYQTLANAFPVFFAFLFLVLILVAGFLTSFFVAFNPSIKQFDDFSSTFVFILGTYFGDSDLRDIYLSSPSYGCLLILVFIISMYFFVLGVTFSILYVSYGKVKAGQGRNDDIDEVKERLLLWWQWIKANLNLRDYLKKSLPFIYKSFYKDNAMVSGYDDEKTVSAKSKMSQAKSLKSNRSSKSGRSARSAHSKSSARSAKSGRSSDRASSRASKKEKTKKKTLQPLLDNPRAVAKWETKKVLNNEELELTNEIKNKKVMNSLEFMAGGIQSKMQKIGESIKADLTVAQEVLDKITIHVFGLSKQIDGLKTFEKNEIKQILENLEPFSDDEDEEEEEGSED